MKKYLPVLTGLCSLLAVMPASAAIWSDTYIGYRHGAQFQEPGTNTNITKDILSLTHTSGYEYGSNFFNVDMLKSASYDPAAVKGDAANGGNKDTGSGAQEVYVAYKHNLSLSKVTGSKIGFGPVKDVLVTGGFDFNAKDTAFAPRVWKLMFGPTFDFAMSKGFFNVSLLYYKEQNHNSFATQKDVSYKGTARLAGAGAYPISLGPVDTNLKGWFAWTGSKGDRANDNVPIDSRPETQVELAWMFDLGKLMGMRKGAFYLGPGFQYWHNKFGNASRTGDYEVAGGADTGVRTPNRDTKCFQIEAEWHF